jgi:hypothetical protein
MPPRITKAFLSAQVSNLNRMLGLGNEVYYENEDGIVRGVEGVYLIDCAYGGFALHKMHLSTGESDIFNMGHVPARQLSELIDAYTKGMRDYRGEN